MSATVPPPAPPRWPLLNLGFRPFFLGASIFAALSVGIWSLVFQYGWSLPLQGLTPYQWHAHEMVYGYCMAVIAGFLLTAVRNWTDLPTAHGGALALLFVCWVVARLTMLAGTRYIGAAALFDGLFIVGLSVAVARPVVRARQWERIAVLGKLFLLGGGNILFYLGAVGLVEYGVFWSVYGGLYLVIGLILTVGRQLVPYFIARDSGLPGEMTNYRAVDLGTMALFLLLFFADLGRFGAVWTAVAAGGLFVLGCVRLAGWYSGRIWRNPLLWSLYLAYGSITLGFLLLAGSVWGYGSHYAAVHAFAFGGIGMVTLGMMARVSLGHTGRDVKRAPKAVTWAVATVVLGTLFRVVVPWVSPAAYAVWIGVAQVLWIVAFAIFAAVFAPIWWRPSLDDPLD